MKHMLNKIMDTTLIYNDDEFYVFFFKQQVVPF